MGGRTFWKRWSSGRGAPQSAGECRPAAGLGTPPHPHVPAGLGTHRGPVSAPNRARGSALTRVPSPLATTPFHTLPEHGQLATQLRFSAQSPSGKLFHGTREASALCLALQGALVEQGSGR